MLQPDRRQTRQMQRVEQSLDQAEGEKRGLDAAEVLRGEGVDRAEAVRERANRVEAELAEQRRSRARSRVEKGVEWRGVDVLDRAEDRAEQGLDRAELQSKREGEMQAEWAAPVSDRAEECVDREELQSKRVGKVEA
eukprot:3162046-Rhodomonas_salina.1